MKHFSAKALVTSVDKGVVNAASCKNLPLLYAPVLIP